MRRMALLFAGGAVWLFLAAIPVFADGGPHVASINSGSAGINADSCAGCHRAHSAQSSQGQGSLLIGAAPPAMCLVCHGQAGVGATTDVVTGLQYTPTGAAGVGRGVELGALRGGGFVQARIGSGAAARISYLSSGSVRLLTKVPVGAPQAVTSAHLPNVGGVITESTGGTAWGNYNANFDTAAYAGPKVNVSCTTCHNPHGNGQYRILEPIPNPAISGIDTFYPVASPGALVADAALPPSGDARNYTVIQTNGGSGTLLASQVTSLGVGSTAGDYFRRKVPWNGQSGTSNDAPNGDSANFTTQIAAWCLTCHTRYLGGGATTNSGDAIFKYRHTSNNTSRNCITCHVAHGSNAQMSGVYSANIPNPGGSAATVGDSRLLKIDNRGTCQACHDPTGTIPAGTFVGPTPAPLLP